MVAGVAWRKQLVLLIKNGDRGDSQQRAINAESCYKTMRHYFIYRI